MTRRMTPTQFRSHLQQVQNQRRQAIDRYNRAVTDYNRKVTATVDKYNREVRAHNARVYANRQRVLQALSSIQNHRTVTTRYVTFRGSVETLHRSYVLLDRSTDEREAGDFESQLVDLSERENANSVEVMDALLEGRSQDSHTSDDLSRLQETRVGGELVALSQDLDSRWRGALFALDPRNPDASRHFCTSAREIFTTILERRAPDEIVKQEIPNCALYLGRPTRRSKIHFALKRKGLIAEPLEQFADDDVQNIIDLFDVFNDGTHGSSGRYGFEQLKTIKTRVEDGILYLNRIFL